MQSSTICLMLFLVSSLTGRLVSSATNGTQVDKYISLIFVSSGDKTVRLGYITAFFLKYFLFITQFEAIDSHPSKT